MSHKKKIFLIDGHAFIFRAYYAMPPLTNAAGENTGAVSSRSHDRRRRHRPDRRQRRAARVTLRFLAEPDRRNAAIPR